MGCSKCDKGIRPGYDVRTNVEIPVFCDCDLGESMRQKAQKNPESCSICHGKGEAFPYKKNSPHRPQCPHVNKNTYKIGSPAATQSQLQPDTKGVLYACVDR